MSRPAAVSRPDLARANRAEQRITPELQASLHRVDRAWGVVRELAREAMRDRYTALTEDVPQ